MQGCHLLTLLWLLPVINAIWVPLSRKSIQLHETVEADNGSNSTIAMDTVNTRSLFSAVLMEILNTTNEIPIPNVSPGCMAVGMELLSPFKNVTDLKKRILILLTSPAGKLLDAWGKIPPRILLGNMAWGGAYDECSSLVDAHYCYSSIITQKLTIPYGSCFPKECSGADVGEIFSILNSYTKKMITFTSQVMCKEPKKYGTGAVVTLAIMVAILVLCAFGTYTDAILNAGNDKTDNSKEISSIIANKAESGKSEQAIDLTSTTTSESVPVVKVSAYLEDKGWIRFIRCFSLLRNTRAIMSTKSAEGAITCINGIRVLSLSWVILGHCYVMLIMMKPDNILNMMTIVHRFSFEAIMNASVSVDSFFLLSGLLVGYLTLKRINKKGGMGIADILMYYLHRYIRLTPSMVLVILIYTNVLPLMLSGPGGMFISQTEFLKQPCLDYWWTDILYINNFYPETFGKECYALVWYLANDMQFYIVAPGILLLMVYVEKVFYRGKLYTFVLVMLLCLISIIITGIIIGVGHLPIVAIGNQAKNADTQNRIYGKPYCRITPYLVGLFLGYLFSRNVTLERFNGRLIATFGWCAAVITGLAVVYGPWHVFKENGTSFTNGENIMYGMLFRFAWGCALAWVIYACHNKVGGLVDKFLSWSFWLPLSRLSYGAYLLHLMVIMFFLIVKQEAGLHYQDQTMIFNFISITFISFICSFILTVCVDYPVANLEKIIFKR